MSVLEPLVSVSVITYNHERFIGRAIDGILAQEYAGDLEILIGEDCSTDGTRSVIRDRAARRGGAFRLREYSSNVGARRNFLDGLDQARGDYIALLDGDDYWTSPSKLARQVQMLESDPSLALSFHAVRRTFEHTDRPDDFHHPARRRPRYTLNDLASFMTIPVSSAVVRASAVSAIPDWFAAAPVGDRALWAVCASHGDIGYLDEVHGVYRVHEQSVSTLRETSTSVEQRLTLIDLLLEHGVPTDRRPWEQSLQRCHYDLAHAFAHEHRRTDAWRQLRRAWHESGGWNRSVYRAEPLKSVAAIALPGPYEKVQDLARRRRRKPATTGQPGPGAPT